MPSITLRISPCKCGCAGSDPWHRASYTRNVSGIVAASGEIRVKAFRDAKPFTALGLARAPWSDHPVQVAKLAGADRGWYYVA